MAVDYMRFITGVHYSKNLLTTLNGMTFLFDPNWEAGISEMPTLPVTFFHLKSIHEVMEADVSQKQMLFYNSQKAVTNDSTTGSVLNVVADNIVIKPKTYRMEVIIPYDLINMLIGNYTFSAEQHAGVTSLLFSGEEQQYNVAPYLSTATPYVDVIKSLLMQVALTDYSDLDSFLTSVTSSPDYNKNSLEAMFKNRSILKLKLWNGWKYKYVALTSIDISKEPDESGVYQATLICQEVPIMTIRGSAGLNFKGFTNPIVTFTGNKIKDILNGMETKK